jgi:hypothetical protein
VATEGYDAKANKQTCAADFALTTTEGEKSLRSPYVVQALESPKGEYRIDIEAYAALVNAAAVDFDIGYERKARARPATPPADAAAPGNETLTGVLKTAATDSCLSVGEGKDEKCYGFGSQSSLAKTLFASCGDANTCVVTGQFDHGKEQLLSVQQAARGK